MTLRSPADALTNQVQWRKNGREIIEDMSGLASVTFRGPITETVAGVYECFYANERNQARHGIVRLIVRGMIITIMIMIKDEILILHTRKRPCLDLTW